MHLWFFHLSVTPTALLKAVDGNRETLYEVQYKNELVCVGECVSFHSHGLCVCHTHAAKSLWQTFVKTIQDLKQNCKKTESKQSHCWLHGYYMLLYTQQLICSTWTWHHYILWQKSTEILVQYTFTRQITRAVVLAQTSHYLEISLLVVLVLSIIYCS